MARQFAFAPFNQGSPLNFSQHHDVPLVALKSLPDFIVEGQTITFEHIRYVATICSIHNITEEDAATKLLAASFKGEASDWFRSLNVGSITSWDRLGDLLRKYFEDDLDSLSLVEQLQLIKRDPREQMTNFNGRFLKTWNMIPINIRPSIDYAFLYFLRSLTSDISFMIQSLGGTSLPQAFNLAVKVENCLIQAGMITPRPPMPISPNFQPTMPLQMPPFTPIPTLIEL